MDPTELAVQVKGEEFVLLVKENYPRTIEFKTTHERASFLKNKKNLKKYLLLQVGPYPSAQTRHNHEQFSPCLLLFVNN